MSKCTKCGKERIFKSSVVEKVGNSTITHTITVCPDPECQKIVEKGLVIEEKKRKTMYEEQEKRANELLLRKQREKEEKLAASKQI